MTLLSEIARIGDIARRHYAAALFPREALESLNAALGCERCGLFSVMYKDSRPHAATAVYIVSDYRAEAARIEQETFDGAVCFFSVNPEAGRLFIGDGALWTGYFPLRLEGHLCAVLSVECDSEKGLEDRAEFVGACLPLFSLWFSGANLRHARHLRFYPRAAE